MDYKKKVLQDILSGLKLEYDNIYLRLNRIRSLRLAKVAYRPRKFTLKSFVKSLISS